MRVDQPTLMPPPTTNGPPPPLPSIAAAPSTHMSATTPQTSAPRSRPQARRKPTDDAAYFGPSQNSIAGSKRQAPDRAEGERQKRKRIDNGVRKVERVVDGERDLKESLVKFTNVPISAIYRYLAHFDLVPPIYPSPLTAEDPPPPPALEYLSGRHASPTPSVTATTPANRPRRESKEKQSRRRSSRHIDDEIRGRPPIVSDVDEAHRYLAAIVERHFVDQVRREEVDILASFMCKVKSHAKGAPGQPACARRSVRY